MSASSAGKIAALNAARLQQNRTTAPPVERTKRSVTRRRARREVADPKDQPAPPEAADADDAKRSALNTLASFIPSEALTFYLAGVPLLNTLDPTPGDTRRLAAVVLFVVALVGNSLLVLLAQVRQAMSPADGTDAGGARFQVSQFVLAFLVTGGAFTLYALTQPNGFAEPSPSWSAYLLLVGVFVLGGIARLFGIKPLEHGNR